MWLLSHGVRSTPAIMNPADLPSPTSLSRAAERLREMLAHAFPVASGEVTRDVEGLRDAVCSYVRAAKSIGHDAQSIIGAVKRMAYESVARETRARDYAELTDGIVRWCVDEFYGTPTDATTVARRDTRPLGSPEAGSLGA